MVKFFPSPTPLRLRAEVRKYIRKSGRAPIAALSAFAKTTLPQTTTNGESRRGARLEDLFVTSISFWISIFHPFLRNSRDTCTYRKVWSLNNYVYVPKARNAPDSSPFVGINLATLKDSLLSPQLHSRVTGCWVVAKKCYHITCRLEVHHL